MAKYIYFLKGQNVYDINQFYDVFYRPDLVAKRIKGEDISKYVGSLKINDALQYPPPKVKIVNPSSGKTISKGDVTVNVKIEDSGGGIGDIRLYQNGKLVDSRGVYRIAKVDMDNKFGNNMEPKIDYAMNKYPSASRGVSVCKIDVGLPTDTTSINIVQPITGTYEKNYNVNLISGRNIITASAFNGHNTVMSSMVSVDVISSIPPKKSKLYALIVGNNQFLNKKLSLRYAIKDSKDFETTIREVSASLFEKINIIRLADATKHEILNELKILSHKVKPQDVFIFFVASHGSASDDMYFIYTSDFDGITRSKNSSISSVELMEYSKLISALKHIYIFDTCQAGGIGSVVLGLYDTRISVLASVLGMHVFAGSKTHQAALDGYNYNGLFTHFFIEGARGKADSNNDRFIKLFELKPYLEQQLSKASYGTQEPFISTFGKDFAVFKID
jgi:hypothetical protein